MIKGPCTLQSLPPSLPATRLPMGIYGVSMDGSFCLVIRNRQTQNFMQVNSKNALNSFYASANESELDSCLQGKQEQFLTVFIEIPYLVSWSLQSQLRHLGIVQLGSHTYFCRKLLACLGGFSESCLLVGLGCKPQLFPNQHLYSVTMVSSRVSSFYQKPYILSPSFCFFLPLSIAMFNINTLLLPIRTE